MSNIAEKLVPVHVIDRLSIPWTRELSFLYWSYCLFVYLRLKFIPCWRNTREKVMSSGRTKVVHLLQSFFESCSSTYCLPYRFNRAKVIYLTESKTELLLWKLNALACLFWAVFTVGGMIQVNMDGSIPISVQVYMRLIAPVICIPFAVVQFPTWKSGRHIVKLATQIEKLFGNGKLASVCRP